MTKPMTKPTLQTRKIIGWLVVATVPALVCSLLLVVAPALAAEAGTPARAVDPSVLRWGYIMAGATTAVSSVAASLAVARVGSAAVGALAEKPELFGRVLVLVGLAEGIAIYGLIVSILILNQLG
jgi:V/A-type H+-transporting ATPase subunit K